MRNRTIMIVIALLDLVIWAGMLTFMNLHPPTSENLVIVLAMWGMAVLCGVMPLSYALNARYAPSLGRVGDMNRALRQGLLAALVLSIMMALHVMRTLPPERALVLVAIVVLLEVIFYLRQR